MRLKRNRLKQYYLRKKSLIKDNEGGTSECFAAALPFTAEVWAAGGKLQAEMYGDRLAYIRNIRMDGTYEISSDEKNNLHYIFSDGVDIEEGDGVCLNVSEESEPDYKIISIRPERFLKLEVEKRR